MAYKHSPEQVASQTFATKKRDWFPWNHTCLSSHSFGTVDPILCEPVTANTTIKLDMFSALQTNPTATPIFDSAIVTDSVFFVPQRILSRGLIADNFMELGTIEDVEVPYVPAGYKTGQPGLNNATFHACLPGSLLNRLGYPAHIVTAGGCYIPLDDRHLTKDLLDIDSTDISGSNTSLMALFSTESINASPVLGYYAICERYFSNPYQTEVSISHGEVDIDTDIEFGGVSFFQSYDVYSLYDIRDYLLRIRGFFEEGQTVLPLSALITSIGNGYNHMELDADRLALQIYDPVSSVGTLSVQEYILHLQNQLSSTGLWCAQFNQGYQTLYFDKDEIDNLEYDQSVELGTTITTQRIARTRFNKMFRTILRGKRFTDWLDIQFGAKLKMCDHPIFCGSNSYNLFFNDVVNQTADNSENGTPLGTAAARGYAEKSGSRPISFTTQEPGYIYVLRTIVPNVSYSSVMPRWANYKTMSSFPMPAYSGSTFQDLRVDDIVTTFTSGDSQVVGKQPLYFDYMQKFNRLQGVFATHLNESYTFKREADVNEIPTENLSFHVGDTFMLPEQFNYAFPSIGGVQQQQNIFIKTAFKMSVLQPLDRSVLHTK